MSIISQTIDSLKGGVSQQPEILKLPEQGVKQINGWSSELGGIKKRNPIVLKKTLGPKSTLGTNPLLHLVDRDEDEKYIISFTGDNIKVFDLEGNSKSVSGDLTYIRTPNPNKDLKVLTIADYTFVVNTTKTVKESRYKNLPDFKTNTEALIVIKGGQYGRRFAIYVDDTVIAEYTLPDGEKPNHVLKLDAQDIAFKLIENFNTRSITKYTLKRGQGYIHLKTTGSNTFNTIKTVDGYNDQLMYSITHYVQTFNKLPLKAPTNYIIKISSDTQKAADPYYVRFNTKESIWEECLGWNTPTGILKDTMPHALVRQEDGSFKLTQLDWSDRKCGDVNTNPNPSFVGSTINDIFLYRNRLGLLSEENVILSRTGKYFDFYPASVAALSDDDPIDVAVSNARVNILKHAIPFDNELILFSDNSQFSLHSTTTLTANNIQLNLASSYAMVSKLRPVSLGKNIYFTNERSGYSSVYRYYTSYNESSRKIADDITSYVPSYIPPNIRSIKGSATENVVALLTEGVRSNIYIYKYYYEDEQLKQQSWSYWDVGVGSNILMCDFLNSKMHLIIETDTFVYLAYIDFTADIPDLQSEAYRYNVDYKVQYEVPQQEELYDANTDITTLKLKDIYKTQTVPFCYGELNVIDANGVVYTFKSKGETWTEEDSIKIKGDLRGLTFTVGLSYLFHYTFSKFLIKQQTEFGVRTTDTGRLQLRRAWINYKDSGFFEVKVNTNKREYKYTMSGMLLGLRDTILGNLNIASGQFKFPCQGQASGVDVSIESKTPTPLHIIGCGWEGLYTRRSNQV